METFLTLLDIVHNRTCVSGHTIYECLIQQRNLSANSFESSHTAEKQVLSELKRNAGKKKKRPEAINARVFNKFMLTVSGFDSRSILDFVMEVQKSKKKEKLGEAVGFYY